MLEFLQSLLPVRGARRSSQWPKLRQKWLTEHPECAACGRRDETVTPHHIVPVHVDPSMELEESNLISLCEHPTWNCHSKIGHAGNWRDWVPHVRVLASRVRDALCGPWYRK